MGQAIKYRLRLMADANTGQSDVLSLTFSPFHPNLICGGTYAGQILLWDTRAKQSPVAKTPLAAGGHTYPVYSMKVVGTQNAHHIMTSGTDGTVCSWLPEVMAQPQVSAGGRVDARKTLQIDS